jgi:negative regulator of flagellin synthesis FlgM
MSIQGIRPNQSSRTDSAQQSQQTERTQAGNTGKGRAAAQSGDRVEVSGDARLMSSALQAANNAPAIRTDKVEAAKAKLASGELGSNTVRLADKMIDSLLNA